MKLTILSHEAFIMVCRALGDKAVVKNVTIAGVEVQGVVIDASCLRGKWYEKTLAVSANDVEGLI